MPLPICTTVLLLMRLYFGGGVGRWWGWVDKGMCSLGGVCRMGMVSGLWIKPFFPLCLPFIFTSSITNKEQIHLRTDDWLEATCKLEKVFFSKKKKNGKIVRKKMKGIFFVFFFFFRSGYCRTWCGPTFLSIMSVCKLAGYTISIIWVLSWNAPHPSIHHHYNSPMVNNHKSNEIHKPLRWCLLSLILGSSDIHGLEVRAFRPIICSIYAIFPSFYHMNYALCHNLPEHFS